MVVEDIVKKIYYNSSKYVISSKNKDMFVYFCSIIQELITKAYFGDSELDLEIHLRTIDNKKDLFPNINHDSYEEEFIENLDELLEDENNKPYFCENFYEDESILICNELKKGCCPVCVIINDEKRKIYRLKQCEGNYAIFEIF